MSRQHETEIKLKVGNFRELRRKLAKLGFSVSQSRHFESNTLYDFPDRRLWKARRLLRLRRTDEEWLLTLKGGLQESTRYKIRGEIETRVEDGERLAEIFEGLGLRPAFRYEKYRTVYAQGGRAGKAGGPVLVFDETRIGNYLELEGPRRWIDGLARQLGYGPADYITVGYGSLYRQWCQARGEKPADLVFPRKT